MLLPPRTLFLWTGYGASPQRRALVVKELQLHTRWKTVTSTVCFFVVFVCFFFLARLVYKTGQKRVPTSGCFLPITRNPHAIRSPTPIKDFYSGDAKSTPHRQKSAGDEQTTKNNLSVILFRFCFSPRVTSPISVFEL